MAPWSILLLFLFLTSNVARAFDVRHHLSTVTSYGAGKEAAARISIGSSIPHECRPIHLNLVARHGTRSPTKKRIRELDGLDAHLKELLEDARVTAEEGNLSLQNIPAWLWHWKSPWRGRLRGGELISKGEGELFDLGIRVREKFPDLFEEEYHPDIYHIKSTQIPRASASAVAFGMGLFSGRGNLGPGHHRAFSVTSESRASDILLRFYDCCESYKDYRKSQEPAVEKLKEPVFNEVAFALSSRYGLNVSSQDMSSLWFLCKQEASLLDITDQACGLFSPYEVSLLEWTDDLEVFILKGYGKSINYRMGVPLLNDVLQSMEDAIKAKEGEFPAGSYEKARLRFAHAETVVPFSCLLGLFVDGSGLQQIRREEPLQLPPKPPQKRSWKGSLVAPFAGNNMLVLYSCTNDTSSKYYVQVLHNEHPMPIPGCDNADFCPFDVFKERVVAPHEKHDYDTVCGVKLKQPTQKSASTTSSPSF